VGGLHDTVVDADADPERGTGFVAASVDTTGLVDALHRAARAWRIKGRRKEITSRGMGVDWSWDGPAKEFIVLYESLLDHSGSTSRSQDDG
jgi:starch synthase